MVSHRNSIQLTLCDYICNGEIIIADDGERVKKGRAMWFFVAAPVVAAISFMSMLFVVLHSCSGVCLAQTPGRSI